MKEPIEELFKQSLGGHEMPYNPDAWAAMNARLDIVSPTAGPASHMKYYIGAAVIGVAAIATYVVMSSGNTPENTSAPVATEIKTEQTVPPAFKAPAGNSEVQKLSNSSVTNQTGTNASSEIGSQSADIMKRNSDINSSEPTQTIKTGHQTADVNQEPKGQISNPDPIMNQTDPIIKNGPVFLSKMKMPAVDDLCLNEETIISNPNGKEIYLLNGLNNVIITIPANKSIIFNPTIVGNYSLGYKNDATIEASSYFKVNRIPDAEFSIDLVNKFENGLPSTHVQAIGGQGTYEWTAKKQSAVGFESDMHFYNKGEKTIELTVNNGQCAVSLEKSIYIEEDYNLMAVTGFTPASNDPKTSTFIPFALTQRDVNFVLTIIDGRDGGLVYQTSDATLPWDGTDIRSGRRSETPQVYVWKAVILNPATNEPSEYRGTITMN